MIQVPRRSVTRFFIPLIDVLTLLFCIFLLMPFVKVTKSGETDSERGGNPAPDADLANLSGPELARRLQDVRRELEQLRKEKIEVLQQRLAVQVLEIDAATGKLYHFDPERVEIASAADAQKLIERRRREAAGREVYVLILFPRQSSGYPEEGQVQQYERWFTGVAHGIDNPRGGR
jgi:hypothetical protein